MTHKEPESPPDYERPSPPPPPPHRSRSDWQEMLTHMANMCDSLNEGSFNAYMAMTIAAREKAARLAALEECERIVSRYEGIDLPLANRTAPAIRALIAKEKA